MKPLQRRIDKLVGQAKQLAISNRPPCKCMRVQMVSDESEILPSPCPLCGRGPEDFPPGQIRFIVIPGVVPDDY